MKRHAASSPTGAGSRNRCPICGRPADPASPPFCSARCADVDLGRWFTGQYRIVGGAAGEDTEQALPDPDPDAA